jgi:Skp family chaperone for outer membrane proteins
METKSNVSMSDAKLEKLNEIQAHQENLKKLQAELAKLSSKIETDDKLTQDEVKYIAELGWLSAAAVTIAAIAAGI